MAGKAKKMVIEIDPATGQSTVTGAQAVPFENLTLVEKVDGALVKHKILSISENAVIKTNYYCYWVVINGVPQKICV